MLALTLLIRAPFFFPAVINWDESTYILMGQEILDGRLPYIELWELKPPLGFVFYAAAIALFGHSILAVRLAGALAVAASALLTYAVGKSVWNWRVGLVAAVMTILLISLMPNGSKVTMLEHIALVPLLGATALLCGRKPTSPVLFAAGLLTMAATMVRLNLAVLALLVGLYTLVSPAVRPWADSLKRGLAYAAGGALVLLAAVLPYLVTGQLRPWWSTMVTGPLSFAGADLPFIGSLLAQIEYVLTATTPEQVEMNPLGPALALVWAAAVLGVTVTALRWRGLPATDRYRLGWLMAFLAGVQLSIMATGELRIHYLIQAAPFMALFAAWFLFDAIAGRLPNRASRYALALVVALVFVASLRAAADEVEYLAQRARAGLPLASGPAYDIAAYLQDRTTEGETVYMMVDHIVHWFRRERPLTVPSAHPSMIDKEDLLADYLGREVTTESELARILDQRPAYIVTEDPLWYLVDHPEAAELLADTLRAEYRLVKRIAATRYALPRYIYRLARPERSSDDLSGLTQSMSSVSHGPSP